LEINYFKKKKKKPSTTNTNTHIQKLKPFSQI
jgi:hypothetical protein